MSPFDNVIMRQSPVVKPSITIAIAISEKTETLSHQYVERGLILLVMVMPALVSLVHIYHLHWNENIVILTELSTLAALEIVSLTTSSAVSDDFF